MSWQIKIDPADKNFSQFIRLRDRMCKRCLSPGKFNDKGLPVSHQCSHFQGRRKENTRFNELNADELCGGCHAYFTEHPDKHLEWQIETKGKKVVEMLILLGNTYCKKDRELQRMYWAKKVKELL